MKTPLLYLNRQRRNQLLLFWWRRSSALFLLYLSLTAATFAQKKLWDKTFGGTEIDFLAAMAVSPDGGYLLGGSSFSGSSGNKSQSSYGQQDYWIVKTDKQGKKLWDKAFGGSGVDTLTAIVNTLDGGYLLGGSSASRINGNKSQNSRGNMDYWVIKIDGSGNKLWDKRYGGSNVDRLITIANKPDGSFLLGGTSFSGNSGDKSQASKGSADYWVVKIDGTGNKLWDKTYGGSSLDNLAALVTTTNDGYLLGGTSASGISGDKSQTTRGFEDYWVIQLDENGTKVWDKTYGGILDSYIDSEFCESGEKDDCTRYFGGSALSAMIATRDGGFLLGGSSNAEKGAEKSKENLPDIDIYKNHLKDYWVVKIDSQGNKVWDNTYGGISNEYFPEAFSGISQLASIIATPEGNFLLAGTSDSDKGRDKSEDSEDSKVDKEAYFGRDDYWVVKIDGNGKKLWDKTFGGPHADNLAVILPAANNEYVLGGSSTSGIGGDKSETNKEVSDNYNKAEDYWIAKIKEDPATNNTWNMRYGGTGTEGFTTVIKTGDGGYLSGGYTNSGVSGDKTQSSQGKNDYWIVKSDKNGKKLWDKRFGGSGDDYLYSVLQTQDGGYLLGGSSLSNVSGDKTQASRGNRDYWIVKVSSTGAKQWDKRFGGSGADEFRRFVQLTSGEFLLAGNSNSPAGGDKSQASQGGNDYWLVKINSTGTKIWDKRYGGTLNENLEGLTSTLDGGFLVGGSSLSGANGDKTQASRGGSDYWIVKIDYYGSKKWDKRFGGSGEDNLTALGGTGTSTGNFFIAGTSTSGASGDKSQNSQGGQDFWMLKINGSGTKLFDKRFGGSSDDGLRSIILTQDGGYLLGGTSASGASGDKTQASQGGNDYWIVKTNANGSKQWDKRFGGSGYDEIRTVLQTNDNGYLLGGRSNSGASGDRTQPSQGGTDYWLVKVAPVTNAIVASREANLVEEPVAKTASFHLMAYPNPVVEKATITFTLLETQAATVRVLDSQGQVVTTLFQQEAKANQTYQVEWQAGKQESGMYLLQLQTPTHQNTQKLLLTK